MAASKKTGHRGWAARSGRVPGKHAGDIMPAETRSRVMSKIKGKNTGPELLMEAELLRRNENKFEKHVSGMPGKPDFVFRIEQVIVFVDGDFWHGYRFPLWQHKLSINWQEKILATRKRDQRNFRNLRKAGWKVLRVWEHQLERDAGSCGDRVVAALKERRLRT